MKTNIYITLILLLLCATSHTKVLDEDKQLFKKHINSLIEWDKTDAKRWLSLSSWIKDRDNKDKNKKWKITKRVKGHKEEIGSFIQCLGQCQLFGKYGASPARFKTRIYEGDEIQTFEKSSAWIVLMDGSLLRLSAFSSISFFEINFSDKKTMLSYRLNKGHIFVSSREMHPDYKTNLMQTDTAFFPLHHIEANQEYYMRSEYKRLNGSEKLKYALELNPGSNLLKSRLERRITSHPQKRETSHFIVCANSTFLISNGQFHLFYETKGESNLIADRADSIELNLRGYNNEKLLKLKPKQYYKVDSKGNSYSIDNSLIAQFSKVRYLVSRVPSIYMAREIELKDFYPVLSNKSVRLGLDYNYYQWTETKLKAHLQSLFEYSRRIETTNLTVTDKYFKNISVDGFTKKYYQQTYDLQLANLSNRDYEEIEKIKQFDQARYYLWVMKNGKKFISTSFR